MSPHFNRPVHCVVVSTDGLVYVCDRANNRIQIFSRAGQFRRQFVFDPETRGNGAIWSIALSPDHSQRFLIYADGEDNLIRIVKSHIRRGAPYLRPQRTQRRTVPLGPPDRYRFAIAPLHRTGGYREAPPEIRAPQVTRSEGRPATWTRRPRKVAIVYNSPRALASSGGSCPSVAS